MGNHNHNLKATGGLHCTEPLRTANLRRSIHLAHTNTGTHHGRCYLVLAHNKKLRPLRLWTIYGEPREYISTRLTTFANRYVSRVIPFLLIHTFANEVLYRPIQSHCRLILKILQKCIRVLDSEALSSTIVVLRSELTIRYYGPELHTTRRDDRRFHFWSFFTLQSEPYASTVN
jgi:hypothetical protein